MAISLLNLFKRKWYSRSILNGEAIDSNLFANVDAQDADVLEALNRITLLLRQITTVSGTLRYSLTQAPAFTATASQTVFTVAAYDNTNDIVFAFTDKGVPANGLQLIDPNGVTKTSSTTVTIPAQSAGSRVVIEVLNVGNGTSQLASTSVGQGAALVGINDAGNLLTAANVETALQELATNLASASYIGGILNMAQYLKKDGTVALTGDLSAGTHKITNLANGTVGGDAVNYQQLQSVITQQTSFSVNFLKTDGSNAMAAPLDVGNHKVTNVTDGVLVTDGATVNQLNLKLSLSGGTLTGVLNLGGFQINNVAAPSAGTDAANKTYVDSAVATAQGSRVLGGSAIDGAWTDANVPATPGIYEPLNLTWSVAHSLPYATILRVNGNVAISNVITVGLAPKFAYAVGNQTQSPGVQPGTMLNVLRAGCGGDGNSVGGVIGGGGGCGGNGGQTNPGKSFVSAGAWSRPWANTTIIRVGGQGGNGTGTSATSNVGLTGGAGGGGLILMVNGNCTMTGGTITADGDGFGGGIVTSGDSGGGGGSILIICNGTITGGTYNARGGLGGNNSTGGGGGGGGRITLVASAFAGTRTGVVTGSNNGGLAGIYEEITLTSAQIAALFDR